MIYFTAQRITYDRKVLLRLQKSVFSQRRPDNIDHIPEIQVVSTVGSFEFGA